jgi:hypothetical protein
VPNTIHDFSKMWSKKELCVLPLKGPIITFFRLRELHILIIDEISMVSGSFLDYISTTLGKIRESESANIPFGGLQLIVCGVWKSYPYAP